MGIQQGKAFVCLLAGFVMFGTSMSAQTNLNFNSGSRATSEGAVLLSWNSTSNEVYTVQYADTIIADTNTGTVNWQDLYIHYPSHGTNTFIGDYGNYNLETTSSIRNTARCDFIEFSMKARMTDLLRMC